MRETIKSFIALLSVMVLGGAVLVVQAPERADGVGTIAVNIFLYETTKRVDVDPGRSGIVTFNGYVKATAPYYVDAQYANIQLTADAGDWNVTDIPILTMTKVQTTLLFSVSVMVPLRTTATPIEMEHKLLISGTWSYEPETQSGQLNPLEAMIVVNQFYLYSITSDPTFIQTSPGSEFDVELSIENEGNWDDEIEVEIEGREPLEDEGWAFMMNQTQFPLPMGKTIHVPIHVLTPKQWHPWVNKISVVRFVIHSSQAESTDEQEVYEIASIPVFMKVQGVSVPGFAPMLALLSILLVALIGAHRRPR